jgi:hypothetical protein
VQLGTTYLEPGPAGIRKGEVVEFESPRKVTFSQPMSLRPYWLGVRIGVRVEMKLREIGNGEVEGDRGEGEGEGERGVKTVVERDVFLRYPWVLWPFKGVVDGMFRRESWRTMEALKKFLEEGGG